MEKKVMFLVFGFWFLVFSFWFAKNFSNFLILER